MSRKQQPAKWSAQELAVRRLVESFNARDFDAVVALFAEEGALHEPFVEAPIAGREALRRFHDELFAAFPDEVLVLDQVISSGEWVVARIRASATHTGEFLGMPPTGRRFEVRECSVFEFRDGLIRNLWVYVDSGAIARQLGFTFAPVRAREGEG